MYIPPANRIDDEARISAFIRRYGFATLITNRDGVPWASQLPILLDETPGTPGVLRGHMARANEQWGHFSAELEVLCIFSGPHAYISPSCYATKIAVPTWNYATVHVYGIAQVVEDTSFLRQVVEDTTAFYEAGQPSPWKPDLPEEKMAALLNAIVGFSIRVTRIEAKFKLGQNRSPEDQAGMLDALTNSPDPEARLLAEFIREQP